MAENYYDLTGASIRVYDPAGRKILGYTRDSKMSFAFMLNRDKVIEMADKYLIDLAYPAAVISLRSNRTLFRLQPGNLFRFSYTPWGISNMICRVVSIQEEDLNSDAIIITALESVDYISESFSHFTITSPDTRVDPYPPNLTGRISNFKVMEAPYALAGYNRSNTKIIPMAGKVTGGETSFSLYESTDGGTSYHFLASCNFNSHGRLAEEYPQSAITIDDTKGILVEFTISGTPPFSDIARAEIFGTTNLAVVGEEFITFQTATLVSGTTYRLLGVNRALYGSKKETHPLNSDFYFIGNGYRTVFNLSENAKGSTRYYKFVPVSDLYVGSLEIADTPFTLPFTGRALCPYPVGNLKANGRIDKMGTYTGDIVLTWSPAYRGTGAGFGVADTGTDAAVSWEGYFRVYTYAHDSVIVDFDNLVRTTEDIDAVTWTYTSAMNTSDNGSLSDYVTFVVTNYKDDYIDSSGVDYESFIMMITIRKE